MEVRRNWFYWLISSSVMMLLALGTWWLYLVFKLAHKLSRVNIPVLEGNTLSMIKWEGATFLLFLFVLTATLLYVYFLDLRKTKALQAFFASLTHELKTPLASMKLQTEVLVDMIKNTPLEGETRDKINTYTQRLLSDSIQLEDQLDNHLQLSRVERDSPLNLRPLVLIDFLKKEAHRVRGLIPIEIKGNPEGELILADDYALQTILRNLFENTKQHNPNTQMVEVSLEKREGLIVMTYFDHGEGFSGQEQKLGELFYKHDSPKGSGIGLYLIRRLMQKMKGEFKINTRPGLEFKLSFKTIDDGETK
ncbi:MAG: hypothetical protein CME65_00345 [Halobacteriovoraceae bacterium]|nr:hypothetical protein [Halobacteriovoraceae bacterium]|tara:strand:- start:11518 stop:12438 length:921 start_codon:yes stop_codon:yes gene_type:complete